MYVCVYFTLIIIHTLNTNVCMYIYKNNNITKRMFSSVNTHTHISVYISQ